MKDLRRLAHYFRPHRRYLILAALLVLVETAFELFIPVLMATLIDEGVANGDIPLMLHQGILMGLFALISLITGFLQARYAARASYGFGADLRRAQYEAVQKLAFSNLDHFETSSLVTRMTTDVTVLQNAFNTGFRAVFRSPVMLLMGLGLSFYMSPPLAVIFFLCVPVLAVILWAIVRKVAPSYRVLQKAVDRMNNVVQEHLTAMRAVKAFVREDYAAERFETVNGGLMDASRYTFKTAVLSTPAFQMTMYGATVLLLWFGGSMILDGKLEVGQLTGFLSYVMQVMNSLMLVANVFLLLTRSLASCHRILEVLDEVPVIDNPANAITEVADGSIDFDDVSFRYSADAKTDALSHVDLHIRSGQTVGILGGKDDAGAADSPALRRHRRRAAGGRPGRAGLRAPHSARGRGHRLAEKRPVFRHGPGKSPVGQSRRHRRGIVGRLPHGLCRRISTADAQGAGQRFGPGRRQRVRRAEATAVHRPGAAEIPENPDF